MARKRNRNVPIICVCSQKGGVGKTTTAAAIIDSMRLKGKKVLGIDCDLQGTLSSVQGDYILEENASTDELFEGGRVEATVDGQATTAGYEDLELVKKTAQIDDLALKRAIDAAVEEKAQVLVTGDIDYHSAIDALANGLCIIDAGHYGTEYVFISYMKKKLEKLFPELIVKGAKIRQPYQVIS